jgi:hypothetical protein
VLVLVLVLVQALLALAAAQGRAWPQPAWRPVLVRLPVAVALLQAAAQCQQGHLLLLACRLPLAARQALPLVYRSPPAPAAAAAAAAAAVAEPAVHAAAGAPAQQLLPSGAGPVLLLEAV